MKIKAYQIEENIKKKHFSSYLIYGQNSGLVKEKIKQIIKIYKKKNENIEIIKFDNDDLINESEKFYNEINTFSFSGNKKLIHVLNANDKIIKNISETIKENTKELCIIIFESGELNPRSKLRKLFEKEQYLGILACYFETENDIKELISSIFSKEKILISNDTKTILVNHLGTERMIIKNELEKIILFLKKKKNFSEEDIINCVSENNNFNLEDLNYSLCNGNLIKLDKIINQLYLEGTNPIILLRSVSKHFQKILFINEKVKSGLTINESLRLLRPPIFFMYSNQFKNQINIWKNKLCYKVIERIFDAERLCKINSQISKIICWRTLRNIASFSYKKSCPS